MLRLKKGKKAFKKDTWICFGEGPDLRVSNKHNEMRINSFSC